MDTPTPKALRVLDTDLTSTSARFSAFEALDDSAGPPSAVLSILRPPNDPLMVAVTASRYENGLLLVEAPPTPGSQLRYEYALLKEVAKVDRRTGEIEPLRNGRVFGVLPQDARDLCQEPGAYYVTAIDDKKVAYLLGPFNRHIDALLRVSRASSHLRDKVPAAAWWAFGTSRIASGADRPEGRLNAEVLTDEELSLLTPPAPVERGDLPDFCFVFNPDAQPGRYVSAVRHGESGYFATTYDEPDPEKAKDLVSMMNTKLGISAEVADQMVTGSMFGWDVPAKEKAAQDRPRAKG